MLNKTPEILHTINSLCHFFLFRFRQQLLWEFQQFEAITQDSTVSNQQKRLFQDYNYFFSEQFQLNF